MSSAQTVMDPPVFTGMAVIAPTGHTVEDHWSTIVAGQTKLDVITRFNARSYPCQIAGQIPDFDVDSYLPARMLPQTDRMTRWALAAAKDVISDSGLTEENWSTFDLGVTTAASCGGFEFGQKELQNLWSKGGQYVSAYQSFAWFYAVNTGQISIQEGAQGPGSVIVSEGAGGLDAFAYARRQLRKSTPMVMVGGIDASLCTWGWTAQQTNPDMSRATDPDQAYQPFAATASGYVPGEGGALLTLEQPDHANQRGAKVYGRMLGHASTFSPSSAPDDGHDPALRRCIELALQDADLTSDDIDVVFADGAATTARDRQEANAIAAVFGPSGVPVTVPKSMTGRLCSGAGSLDVTTALLAIEHNLIPVTTNTAPDSSYPIDLVTTQPRRKEVHRALLIARGYGGFNAALVISGP